MSIELIKLTGQEIAVQHVEVTLYDIAKRFNRRHDNLVRDFELDINKLAPTQLTNVKIEEMFKSIKIGNNATRKIK